MSDREWREAGDLHASRLVLLTILVVAAVLRFWALGHGIPFAPSVDEPEIVERAVNILRTGSLDPHFYDYPALYLYLQAMVACARFLYGAMAGSWSSLGQAAPADFYLWGRALTAALGVVTVLLVFHIGMRWGARHGLLAAGLLAVHPLHVRQSHYVLTDVPLTFFVALTLLLSLRARERRTVGAFAWGGVAAGLAAATKYNGLVAIIIPLLACWTTPGMVPSRLMCALALTGASALAFLAGAPYTVLDLPTFLDTFARLSSEYRTGALPSEPGWLLYLKHLRLVFGWPAFLLIFAGLVLGVFRLARGPGRERWALLAAFPLLYFWLIADQRLIYGRYLLPMVPALSVLAAVAVVSGVSLLRRYEIPRAPRTALITGLTVAALLPPAVQSVGFDRAIARRSTLEIAHDWVLGHLPPGTRIAVETRGLLLPREYDAVNVPSLIRDEQSREPRDRDAYITEGFQYLIASSQSYGDALTSPHRAPGRYAAYRRLFDESEEVHRIMPSDEHPGPELRIYRLPVPGPPAPAAPATGSPDKDR